MDRACVLDVGNCDFDHASIRSLVRRYFDADVDRAKTADQALAALRKKSYTLTLVNRILNGDGSEGVDLITQARALPEVDSRPIMLISNFPEAHKRARAAGAVDGFGKRALTDGATRDKLARHLPLLQTATETQRS